MEETELTNTPPEQKTSYKLRITAVMFVIFVIVTSFVYSSITASPIRSESKIFVVDQGMSVKSIAEKAAAENVVGSEMFLYVLLTTFHDPTNIFAGRYVFTPEDSIYNVADKLASSKTTDELVSLTFPEGFTVTEFSRIATDELENFVPENYVALTQKEEGYLFPETYFVPDWFTTEDVIELQKTTFAQKVEPLLESYSGELTREEVIILASIIEREANDEASMKTVSSVLQNRLDIGMPLQADASIEYVLDKPLSELTSEDLEIDSPYNTYSHNDLPPTPIGNPGLTSIEAVIEPDETDYFYYITDEEGEFHYARTFAEHNQNIDRYLR